MTTVLVVDDEQSVRYTLRAVFEEAGHTVEAAGTAEEALQVLERRCPDVMITDLAMPGMDGMELLRASRKAHPTLPVIMITAHGSERRAVEAMKEGAWDYLRKPFDIDEIVMTVDKAVERLALRRENTELRAQLTLARPIIYRSESMARVLALTHRAATRDVTVLITGETGTGKELVAQAIHELSARSRGPLVRFNMAALPEGLAESELFGHERGAFTGAVKAHQGLFERAHGGILLLDEVGEMPLALQAKLLRVLQEGEVLPVGGKAPRKVDVRILAATQRDLRAEVDRGAFREDLYYRLHVVELHVPPLRERPEDIAPLVAHFMARHGGRLGLPDVTLSPEVLAHLASQRWPGNVRELENTVERLLALCDGEAITIDDLALVDAAAPTVDTGAGQSLRGRVEAFEAGVIREALERNGGNQSATARELLVSRVTLIDKLTKYALR